MDDRNLDRGTEQIEYRKMEILAAKEKERLLVEERVHARKLAAMGETVTDNQVFCVAAAQSLVAPNVLSLPSETGCTCVNGPYLIKKTNHRS